MKPVVRYNHSTVIKCIFKILGIGKNWCHIRNEKNIPRFHLSVYLRTLEYLLSSP